MPATTLPASHHHHSCTSHSTSPRTTFSPSVARYPYRPTHCPLPPPESPRRMHELRGDQAPTSPYANMSIPFFDRAEANSLSELAGREYRSLAESVSTDGLVARLRETDRAAMQKVKGSSQPQSVSQTQKT
ncbi:hypothetical protein JCM8208_006013 [Rhodotorula glutinis]